MWRILTCMAWVPLHGTLLELRSEVFKFDVNTLVVSSLGNLRRKQLVLTEKQAYVHAMPQL